MSGNSSGFFFAEKQQQQIQQNTLDPLGPNSDENKPFHHKHSSDENKGSDH